MQIETAKFLKHLYLVSEWFGLAVRKPKKWLKLANAVIIIFLAIGMVLHIREIESKKTIYYALEVAIYFLNAICNMVFVALVMLCPNVCSKLMRNISEIDAFYLSIDGLHCRTHYYVYWLEIIVINGLALPYYIYCMQQYNLVLALSHILHLFMMTLSVLLIYNVALILRHRFTVFNCRLRRSISPAEIRRFTLVYDELCDVIDEHSEIFGLRIMAIYLVVLLTIIKSINFGINYFTFKYNMSFEMFFRRIFLKVIIIFVFTFMITISCGQACREAKRTKAVCYELIKKARAKNNVRWRNVIDELLLLARMVNYRQPNFSAFDFFHIDYPILFSLVNCITTYTIVVIEIKRNFSYILE
ncbi:PREDICTED: uncharacterized protein LOC108567639 [Nicrophorus vespilloides]|uniref:Gustatory receptor n=1 Tax=Nicrophorus vespilloides TaxID=110193 RepID=A0ABM1NA71_NICVS|nr:PREDICTED: uncharacterized protein LOC108567639 [Nicrophorus vespilloides]